MRRAVAMTRVKQNTILPLVKIFQRHTFSLTSYHNTNVELLAIGLVSPQKQEMANSSAEEQTEEYHVDRYIRNDGRNLAERLKLWWVGRAVWNC